MTNELAVFTGRLKVTRPQFRVLISKALITLAIAGIRGGKTHIGGVKSLLYAIEHPTTEDEVHVIGSPTYQMSKVPVEKIFKLVYDKTLFPVCPLIKYQKSERTFVLASKDGKVSRLQARSLHDPDRWRGIKALSAWLDEGAYISRYAWDIVQGRLADSNGPVWVTTTPSGYNWIYELYDQARKGDKSIAVVHWTSTENTFANQTGLTNLINRLDAKTHDQEVNARFVRNTGTVYYTFSRENNVIKRRFNPQAPVWVGQDFNVSPMASSICQPFTTPSGEEGFHIFSTREADNSDTYGLVTFLRTWCKENHVAEHNVTIFADAAGGARSTTGKSDLRILRSNGFKVEASARNPLVKDRINCVNGLLRPLNVRHPRITVDPDAHRAIECLEKQTWNNEVDPPQPDKTSGFDHLNEGVGYIAWKKWPLKAHTHIPQRKAA